MSTYTIKSGDTFTTIAGALGLSVAALEAANPGVDPTKLQVGQVIKLPGTLSHYTVQAGDTFTSIAAKLGITVAALEGANSGVNPNNLQVGQQIIVPAAAVPGPAPAPAPIPAPAPAPTPSKPAKLGFSVAAIEQANPGVDPTKLQVGQVINLPSTTSPAPNPSNPSLPGNGSGTGSAGSEAGRPYVFYSGPASSFPSPSLWAPYSTLWAKNASLMTYSDSASEIALIGSAITTVSNESGIDARVILCIIMQESGGNVRVGNTNNGVENTGIMQAFNGSSFNAADASGSILRMVRDGSEGTAAGPGLKQAYAQYGNWYEAARKYNSGSVDRGNLGNALGATANYVTDFANRLMGHVWAGM